MKKLWYLLALAMGMLIITSCEDDDDGPIVDPDPDPVAYDITASTDLLAHPDYDEATSTLHFYKLNTYTLEGIIYIPSGMTLDIEEGTVIKAKEVPGESTTALVITRGAKIMAEGTVDEPIVFTSIDDDIENMTDLTGADNQLWGGLVLLGYAGISNKGSLTNNVEGIDPVDETTYGGTQDNDNSGVLRYVSIRHTGAELAPGDEIQGLTLGGVGSGTTIEYVESFASSDDGIEIFGGNVSIKYFAVAFSEDDCFDLDLGWQGSGQYLFALKGATTGNAMAEWDGASPDDDPRYTSAAIANATFIGSGNDASSEDNTLGMVMRDGFGGQFYNSIVTGVNGYGIEVEDLPADKDPSGMDSYSKLEKGMIKIESNIFWVGGNRNTFVFDPADGGAPSVINVTKDADDATGSYLSNYLEQNNNSIGDPGIMNTSRNAGAKGINPVPTNTGLVSSNLAQVPGLENPGYKGAFDPASQTTWMDGWTALSQMGYIQN